MDMINILPSPPEFLRTCFRLSSSLYTCSFNAGHHRTSPERITAGSFDLDPQTGFFPRKPLPKLAPKFPQYAIWEAALQEANGRLILAEFHDDEDPDLLISGEEWREAIRQWPVLSINALIDDIGRLQRAHLVLAWLVNFYVHSLPPSDKHAQILVPKALAVPLVQVSRRIGIAPVLTFADTVLWNWELIDDNKALSEDNIRFINLFSGTPDERHFYHASAQAELRGVEILRIIEEYHKLPNIADLSCISKISRDLVRLAGIVEDIRSVIQSVRDECNVHVFYYGIRPWYEGSDAKGPSHPGWIYEGVEDSDSLDLSGPSAGQSSVMHALDIFLDIDHKLLSRRYPLPSSQNKLADHGFMERMRRYMPGKHREYLANLAASPRPLRELVQCTPTLREPYNMVIGVLKELRNAHLRVACLYVVSQSHNADAMKGGCPLSSMQRRERREPVRGTGGNALTLLLKSGRDATVRAAV